jgi:hypothetical protein
MIPQTRSSPPTAAAPKQMRSTSANTMVMTAPTVGPSVASAK